MAGNLIFAINRQYVSGGKEVGTKLAKALNIPIYDQEIPEMAAKNGITKTALILIGNFLGKAYERSKLYAPDFSHGYRTAQKKGPSNAD